MKAFKTISSLFLLTMILLLSRVGFGQTTIVTQDFDGGTPIWNYTQDIPFFDNGWGNGFYGIIASSSASPLDNVSFSDNILGENDLNNPPDGTSGQATIFFDNINVSGYTDVELSFDYQFIGYNANNDDAKYELIYDENTQGEVFLIQGGSDPENMSGSEIIDIPTNVKELSFSYLIENNGLTGYSGIDNIRLEGIANDIDSNISIPDTQIPPGDIIVDEAINVTNSVPIFKFDVHDIGGDGFDTELTHVRVIPGPNNTANWGEVIAGVRLKGDGNNISQQDQDLSITDEELIIEVTNNNGEMTIANGTSKEYTINIFINPDFAIEGQIIQMAIDNNNDHFFVKPTGSMISRNITGFTGNGHTIEIEGNKLEFLINPSITIINEAMSTVQVAYTDDIGKVDPEFNAQVSISSTGTLAGDPVSETAVDGIASFSNLVHTSLDNNLTLTASSPSEADIVGSSFDIIPLPELFISEVADPDISDGKGKYVEIFNAGTTLIDFDNADYFLCSESNGGGSLNYVKLVGTINPKSYYIIGKESNFNTVYNFSPDYNDNDNLSTVSGNGNDSYFISRDNTDDNALRNSRIDIYGVLNVDGSGEEWEYTNGRAYRKNPDVKNASPSWLASEWEYFSFLGGETDPGLAATDMTPGYGDNDYIYNGVWDDIGLGNPNTATTTDNQNIFIRSDSIALTQSTSIEDLIVRSGAKLTLKAGIKLIVKGDIVNEGTIIFESNANGSAVLEAIADNTRVVGHGFEIHRYIPSENRAFRYLSPSVTTTGSDKPSINDNWQEGQNNTTLISNSNTKPGFGTHITGSTTGANGFDATETGNPSMFSWDKDSQGWNSIPNTDSKPFKAGEAYAILIRGDRSTTLGSNTAVGPETILRTTGKIKVGDFVLNNDDLSSDPTDGNNFNFVGNPYQSQVNLQNLLDDHSTDIDKNHIYVYDPTLGDIGGYAVVDLDNGINGSSQGFPLNSSVPLYSNANEYLQPNQAFFVKTTGGNPEITFTEQVKDNSIGQTAVFSYENIPPPMVNISLKADNDRVFDGVRIVYDSHYSSNIDDFDATKAWNFNESLSVYSNNTELSIEKRQPPVSSDTTQLHIYNYTKTAYSFEVVFDNVISENLNVFLNDQYTQNSVAIMPNQLLSYDFTVNHNIPETVSTDRFFMTYGPTSLSVNDYQHNFSLYPNPVSSNQFSIISKYPNAFDDIKHIELYSLEGQLIKIFKKSDLKKEQQRIKINVNQTLADGIYVLRLKSIAFEQNLKLILRP